MFIESGKEELMYFQSHLRGIEINIIGTMTFYKKIFQSHLRGIEIPELIAGMECNHDPSNRTLEELKFCKIGK